VVPSAKSSGRRTPCSRTRSYYSEGRIRQNDHRRMTRAFGVFDSGDSPTRSFTALGQDQSKSLPSRMAAETPTTGSIAKPSAPAPRPPGNSRLAGDFNKGYSHDRRRPANRPPIAIPMLDADITSRASKNGINRVPFAVISSAPAGKALTPPPPPPPSPLLPESSPPFFGPAPNPPPNP